jgi:outer membrane cobalamin receptor
LKITLGVAAVATELLVQDADTLIDPNRTGAVQHIGRATMDDRRASAPGRDVLDLVNTQPGWLLEANGILHPRGSEYQVQYVIDGIPIADNRSPAFAQSLGVEEFESMNIRTGNYPAEYGRKLGGVIEVSTERDRTPGLHGRAVLQGGSFATQSGYASLQYATNRATLGVSGEGMRTERYLDGPVEENFTNRASGGGGAARFDFDSTDNDRTRMYVLRRRTGFLVPNELLQEQAGQRQDRSAQETMGHITHQHVFSPRLLGNVRWMSRDTRADLWSNPLSTPIAPFQDRGFRESYVNGSLSGTYGRHEWKTGVEAVFGSLEENFAYRITAYRLNPGNVRIFDRDVPAAFNFHERGKNREQAFFVQDLWRIRNWTVSAGLRYDHYKLVAQNDGWSPRFAVSYHVAPAGLVLHASYDRTFETPAVENILLASADHVAELGGEGSFLPLQPSRGHFFEAGFAKSVGGRFRIDGVAFRRAIVNFADDSVLFNTGVSFPITFSKASVYGYEAKLDMPSWGMFSGFVSYSNMGSQGYTPVTGGLFLGDEAEELLSSHAGFPITQDQRNTVRARVHAQLHKRAWVAFAGRYNSGLPVELEGATDEDFVRAQYGDRILERVNFERGRVRPSSTLDLSAGVDLWKQERRRARVVADVLNFTDRLNVINFAGVFSGTAIEPGRSFSIRLQTEF